MPTSPLLARITFALSAVSLGIVACGETNDGGTGATGGSSNVGGTSSGGTSNGGNNVGGSGIGGAAGACLRALPGDGQACRVFEDCPPGGGVSVCLPPGQSSCGGIGAPPTPTCETDAECTSISSDWVCQPESYGGSQKRCSDKCTATAACAPQYTCDVGSGHCEPISCATGACPADTYCNDAKVCTYQNCNASRPCGEGLSCSTTTFTCAPTPCTGEAAGECSALFACDTATKTCARRTCGCDTECPSDGFCLAGSCYGQPGHCDGGCAIGRPLLVATGEPIVADLVRAAGWS